MTTRTAPFTHKPGMDGSTGRCGTCDSRQCGAECGAQEGYVYVASKGWMDPVSARVAQEAGRIVYWEDVWTEADGGHTVRADWAKDGDWADVPPAYNR